MDEDEVPLALVSRRPARGVEPPRHRRDALEEAEQPPRPTRAAEVRALEARDRLRPGTAGALAGLFAGAAAVAVVHALEPAITTRGGEALAARLDATLLVGLVSVHAAGGLVGSIVGAAFAKVTRHLRRFVPLLFWALVFFPSLALLSQVAAAMYAPWLSVRIDTWLAASAAFAFVFAFELPLRRRS